MFVQKNRRYLHGEETPEVKITQLDYWRRLNEKSSSNRYDVGKNFDVETVRQRIRVNALCNFYYFCRVILERDRFNLNLHEPLCRYFQRVHFKDVLEIPRGHNKCLPLGEEVLISTGEYLPVEQVEPGMLVASMSDMYEVRWTRVKRKQFNLGQPCKEILFRSGRKVRASANHPFRTMLSWINAEDLSSGDRIAVTKTVDPPTVGLDLPYAEILGWFLGDGSFSNQSITNENSIFRMMIAAAAQRAGGSSSERPKRGIKTAYVRIRGLRPIWYRLGLMECTSGDKFIPQEVFRASKESIRILLMALFACDGCATKRNGIVLVTKSERMAKDVSRLLLRFSIISVVKQQASGFWYLRIGALPEVQKFFQQIGWIKRSWVDFGRISNPNLDTVPREWRAIMPRGWTLKLQNAGIRIDNHYATSKDKVRKVGDFVGSGVLRTLAGDSVFWDEVVSVRDVGMMPTVDLEVEGGNFAVSDVITHNTSLASECWPIWRSMRVTDKDIEYIQNLRKEKDIYDYSDDFLRYLRRVHNPNHCFLIASSNLVNAKRILRRIRQHWENRQMLRTCFPEMLPRAVAGKDSAKRYDGKWGEEALSINRSDRGRGESTYECIGVDGALQSRHYEHLILDDLIGKEAIESALVMERAIEWFKLLPGVYESYEPGFPGDELVIGNRWAFSDLNSWIREEQKDYVFHRRCALECPRCGSDTRLADFTEYRALCGCGEPCTPIYPEQFNLKGLYDIYQREGGYNFSCTPGFSPVLMADWTEKQISQIRVGDVVIGWKSGKHRQRLCESKVVAIGQRKYPVVRLTMASGRVAYCTPDHKWKVRSTKSQSDSHSEYLRAEVGRKLFSVVSPLPDLTQEQQRALDWLGGIIDGEGSCHKRGSIIISQSHFKNPEVCEMLEKNLRLLGISYKIWRRGANALNGKMSCPSSMFTLRGGRNLKRLLFLKSMMAKRARIGESLWLGGGWVGQEKDEIVKMEFAGEMTVHSMQTTTGNYVVWGYASKNCQYQNTPSSPETQVFQEKWLGWYELYDKTNPELPPSHVADNITSGTWIRHLRDHGAGEFLETPDRSVWSLSRYMTIDPSGGSMSPVASRHAIVVTGVAEDNKKYLLDVWAMQSPPEIMIQMLYILARKWKLHVVHCEAVSGFKYLPLHLNTLNETMNLTLRVEELDGFVDTGVAGLTNRKDKRITNLSPYFQRREMFVRADQQKFLEEYATYPRCRYPSADILDALAYGPTPKVWQRPLNPREQHQIETRYMQRLMSSRGPTGY